MTNNEQSAYCIIGPVEKFDSASESNSTVSRLLGADGSST